MFIDMFANLFDFNKYFYLVVDIIGKIAESGFIKTTGSVGRSLANSLIWSV